MLLNLPTWSKATVLKVDLPTHTNAMLLHLPTWSKATVLKVSGEVEVEVALGERGWREEDQRTPGYVTVAITCDRKAVIKVRVCAATTVITCAPICATRITSAGRGAPPACADDGRSFA